MSAYTTEWINTYNKANVTFAKDCNSGYNGDKAVGKLLKQLLEDANNSAALSGCLQAIDKIDIGGGSPKQQAARPANIKLYKVAMAKLESAATKQSKEFDQAQLLKLTIKDKNGYNLPTPIKTVFPDTYRQLKIMHTEMKAIVARAANELDSAVKSDALAKISADKNKAKDKVKGDDDVAKDKVTQISQDAGMKIFMLKFAPSFKSSMAKGAVVIQKIKASPDLKTYNLEMNNGGRDISQNLVNVAKLKADAKFKDTAMAKALPAPGTTVAAITPFANGAKRTLPITATPADVKEALAEFTELYKKIAVLYKDVLSGKIK